MAGVFLSFWFIQSNYSNFLIRDTLYYFSKSYFIYDSSQIILSRKTSDSMLLVHHGLGIILLSGLYTYSEPLSISYCILELSNFFNYIVYHMIKSHYSKYKILCMKLLQLIWVFYFRIYHIGKIIYRELTTDYIIIPALIIYILSLLWWGKQCKMVYYDLKKIKSN